MDGRRLSELLLSKGYEVYGIVRRAANDNTCRLTEVSKNPSFNLVYGDVTDSASMSKAVAELNPDEFYHLAANSFVATSWNSPSHYIETNTIGTVNCLEALRQFAPECRFYFAGSSEMYGDFVKRKGGDVILSEDSPMIAASPYGVSKVAGYQMTRIYRESYDMFATCGILFNHSDELRGEEFFTRKVTSQLSKVSHGLQPNIKLGNLSASRDEGASEDYVKAMHLMLQASSPDDFVIATGETHTCQEWVDLSLDYFDLPNTAVSIDKSLFRPNEVNVLIGDASKAREVLGWTPSISFQELNNKMCKHDDEVNSCQNYQQKTL